MLLRPPGFGDRRKAMLEDIATLTGGTLIAEDLGIKLESIKIADLGRAKRLRLTRKTQLLLKAPETMQRFREG